MKVLGKVWRNASGGSLTLEFYVRVGGEWWKTTDSITVSQIPTYTENSLCLLPGLIPSFTNLKEVRIHGGRENLRWKIEVVVSLMNKKRKEEIWKQLRV